jgi:hypothetical protein
MKRKINILVILLVLTSVIAMQSCKKDAPLEPKGYTAAMPTVPIPANAAVVPFTGAGQAVNLKWTATATNAIKWTVFFGKSSHPGQVATNVATNSYTATIGTTGGMYYWQVETTDANNITTISPVWSFDVNSNPAAAVLTAPANLATGFSTTGALTWTCTDPESDALTYDVYLGTTATPTTVVASGISATTFSPTMAYSTTYYWKVVAKDPYGGTSTSAINSFTTGAFVPDFSVFNGVASEVCTTFGTAKKDVFVQVNTAAKTITMFLPIADAMVGAGWGTVYTGSHPITVSYDATTFVVTSTKQAWTDSFIDPVEMGPMSMKVATGSTIDAVNKKIMIKWTVSGNAYWGADYTLGTATYTMK